MCEDHGHVRVPPVEAVPAEAEWNGKVVGTWRRPTSYPGTLVSRSGFGREVDAGRWHHREGEVARNRLRMSSGDWTPWMRWCRRDR